MTSMLQRTAATAACALLLACPASAQLIGSGHVMGNGTSSPAAPTDTSLLNVLNQSGSGLSRAGTATKLATVSGVIPSGHCRSTDANGNDVDAGGTCTVGGGTVSPATIPAAPLHAPIAVYTGSPGTSTTVGGISVVPPGNGGAACANLEEFGGAGDNSTDNAAPLNNALAAFASNVNGGCVSEGSGHYKFLSAISYTYPTAAPWGVSIFGSGAETTIFDWPTGNGISFTLKSNLHTFHLRDVTIATGGNGSGDAFGVTNSAPPAGVSWSDITNVTFRGDNTGANYWTHAFLDSGVSFINFTGDAVWGGGANPGLGVGFLIQSTSAGFGFAIVFNIDKTGFFNLSDGFVMGTLTQGVFISNSNFTNGTTGIFVPSGDVNSDQLFVTNTQFGTNGNEVLIESAFATSFVGDYFIVATGQNGLNCLLCGTTQIEADKFTAATTTGSGAGIIVTANSTAGATVTGNTFVNLANGVACANPGATCNVQSNGYSGNTAKSSPASSIGNITIGGGSQ